MGALTPELAKRHYAEHVKKDWYPELEAFITDGPQSAEREIGLFFPDENP